MEGAVLAIENDRLWPDEKVLWERRAAFVVVTKQYGLAARWTTWWGSAGKEPVSGKIYVTNFRIVFSSSRWNRMDGEISIPLSNVISVAPRRWVIWRGATVETRVEKYEFAVRRSATFIAAVEQARDQLTADDVARMREYVAEHPRALGQLWSLTRWARTPDTVGPVLVLTGKSSREKMTEEATRIRELETADLMGDHVTN